MEERKSVKKLLSVLLVFVLLFSSLATFAQGNVNDEVKSLKKDLEKQAKEKIHPNVQKAIKKSDDVEVLVYLKDRIDPNKVAKSNVEGKTPYERKLSSRKAVLNALIDKAETSQLNLIKYLEQEKKKGKVSDFESHYIVNMVYVKGHKDIVENISYMDEVEKVYLNKKIDDGRPDPKRMKGLLENDNELEWNIERVGAPLAWDLGIEGSGAVVGLIDTGADWTHEALKTSWRGYDPNNPDKPISEGNWFDAVSGRNMPYDEPSVPHGSHVLGTILGQGPEGKNKIGVAPKAKWIAAKAFTEDGGYDNWLLSAGEWMLAPEGDPSLAPDVINNSWSSSGGNTFDEWYRDMVKAWRAAGILPVFAAGNERLGPSQPGSIPNPANYPESFAVAATDKNDKRASFSKQGPGPYGDDIKPEISAPGVGIRSSVPGGYEGGWNGTSMATPHIVGATALLLSSNNSLTPDEIENIIQSTATPLTDSQYKESPNFGYGYGLLNVFDAVSEISTGSGTIKGRVIIDGEDIDDPEIEHEAMRECFIGADIPIEAKIKDDISIVDTQLFVKQDSSKYWIVLPMELESGNEKEGIYKGTIPADLIKEPGISYKIKVRDFGGNIVETEEYNIKVKFGILPGEYKTDFETYPLGWTLGGDWEWGTPSPNIGGPKPYSGEKLIGTKLDGNYPNNSDSLLITPPIDLRDENIDEASFKFFHWYETENRYDKGQILITNDYGEKWTEIGPMYSGDGKTWEEVAIDLKEYLGSKNPIFIGFRFTSDISINKLGWYIDNVSLEAVNSDKDIDIKNKEMEKSEEKTIEKLKEGYVEPKGLQYKIEKSNKKSIDKYEKILDKAKPKDIKLSGIPADATVTVLETGRSVRTDPRDGSYLLKHVANKNGESWTLRAEAYGYYPKEIKVSLNDGETVKKNFNLDSIPTGRVVGRVFDRHSKEPAKNARIRVKEDSRIEEVVSDEEGRFTIPAIFEGSYTLKVIADGFEPEEIAINVKSDRDNSVEIPLKRFVGYEEELIYDDGTAENALVLRSANSGLATRMTPTEYGKVKGANIYFWDESWPNPGGNEIGIVLYESQSDGEPGKMIGKPKYVTIERGGWNYIDLSDFGFSTDKDFYISTFQNKIGDESPGTGIDENGKFEGRSYLHSEGSFQKLTQDYGNVMIRGVMEYSLEAPKITNLKDINYTNKDEIKIEGSVIKDAQVNIYINGEKTLEVQSENKLFSGKIELPADENSITATAVMNGKETEPSTSVKVIKDKTPPELNIISPEEDIKTNKEVVHVTGSVEDEHFNKLFVNEKEIKLKEDGTFEEKVLINSGENTIKIKATDLAGNETVVERKVYQSNDVPVITDIKPDKDIRVKAGGKVDISFRSEITGGKAQFRILVPTTLEGGNKGAIEMVEKEPGFYTGTWTVPKGTSLKDAMVEIEFIDTFGNSVVEVAEGRITTRSGILWFIKKLPIRLR